MTVAGEIFKGLIWGLHWSEGPTGFEDVCFDCLRILMEQVKRWRLFWSNGRNLSIDTGTLVPQLRITCNDT
ncbi:hypothetical protein IGI04_041000 [Brassica rapa subsp. trilocularis]|uniref:Uncharacterized protein n=1 Tax=Brassica rapa subsp. trilocularis TaxID=1813537 RepID=A0ABQ7KPH8_BRACM|nr:hypothetical protein IGI04_041000 [Brassica rapa subsp. trilocularis]